MTEEIYDTVIIGSGVAGMSAAIYSERLGLKSIVIGTEPGGTIMNASMIENYPGFTKISGKGLMNKINEHAKGYNPKILQETVTTIKKNKDLFEVETKKNKITTKTIIFCTGAAWKKLNVPGEEEYAGKGVHYCALCDGFFYKNKTVALIGGGDSAIKEAILLSNYAKKVYIISRSKLTPEPINLKKVQKNKKIEIIEGKDIKEIKGTKFVESLILSEDKEINVEGIFVEIGREPISTLAKKIGVKVNSNKEIIIDKEAKTNVNGIYAAGDVTDIKIKQAITGVGEAVKAAYSAYSYLNKKDKVGY